MAAVTNVERVVQMHCTVLQIGRGVVGQTASTRCRCRVALTNPEMARTMSSTLGLKQPTPLQMGKIGAYLLTAGLLYPSGNEQ